MDPPLFAFITLWIQRVVAGIWMWRVGAAELHYYRDAAFCAEWGRLFDIQDGVMYFPALVAVGGVLPLAIPCMFPFLSLYANVWRTHRRIRDRMEHRQIM
jgi:hypothetical protein